MASNQSGLFDTFLPTPISRALFFLGLFLILGVLVVNIFVHVQSKPFIFSGPIQSRETIAGEIPSTKTIPQAEVAILLGASVYKNGELTPLLTDRANTAAELYHSGLVERILVTGDNSTKYYNEVAPIRSYLLGKGIPADDIIVDNAGLDTFDSMYRAVNVFHVRSALVVSQRFHLYRAIYVARRLGIEAFGVAADRRPHSRKNNIREMFATVKSVWEVACKYCI